MMGVSSGCGLCPCSCSGKVGAYVLVLFNWKDLLRCGDLGCTVSSSLSTVAGVL